MLDSEKTGLAESGEHLLNGHNDYGDVQAVVWKNGNLSLLDQRILPEQETYLECKTVEDVYLSIKSMVVRGAPAIGITAAYGAVLAAQEAINESDSEDAFLKKLKHLSTARPTAVNLAWAINTIIEVFKKLKNTADFSFAAIASQMEELAIKIHEDDVRSNKAMGQYAALTIKKFSKGKLSVLTHCNAGSLATGGYGTALGAIRACWQHGLLDMVYADETRPWLQGARLTAWELNKSGIPVTLNTEGAASWLMKTTNIQWVIVGADRIAANGDVANKIGTYCAAISAKYHGVKVMVVAPSSTIDMAAQSGKDIEIEERSASEVTEFKGSNIAPRGVIAANPVFDVTPASLIDYIVTEKGVVKSPTKEKMESLFL